MGTPTNIDYANYICQKSMYLKDKRIYNNQIINTKYVLGLIDKYNQYYGSGSTAYETNGTTQAADKIYVDYVCDRYLQPRLIHKITALSKGQSQTLTIPFSCIAEISFDFFGDFVESFLISTGTGMTTLFGYSWDRSVFGHPARYTTIVNGHSSCALAANQGQEIYIELYSNVQGAATIQNFEIKTKLRANEIFIKTPFEFGSFGGTDVTTEFYIAESGTYEFSFFYYVNTATPSTVKPLKLSYRNSSGVETTLFEPDTVPSPASPSFYNNSVYCEAGGRLVFLTKRIAVGSSSSVATVVEFPTIKGTK
jgi:hypothetical protein